MVRKNTTATLAEALDFLTDPVRAAATFGTTPSEVFRAYAQRAMAADPGLNAQLRQQLGDRGLARVLADPASRSLYRPDAPGSQLDGEYASLGEFALAVRNKSARLDPVRKVMASFGSEVPADGGFLIPEEYRSDLMLWSLESSVVRPRAIVFPSRTLRIGIPAIDDTTHASSVLGGVTAYWVEEGVQLTESQAAYQRIWLDAKKSLVYHTAPNELIADAGVFDVYLRQTLPAAIAWYQDKAFISGTGAGEPQGYRNAPCAVTVNRATGSHITFADIPAMLARLLPQSLNRACWVCSPSALVDMLSVYQNFGAATSGVIPPSWWVQRTPDGWTLLGMPLEVTEHAAVLGSKFDLSLVDFGLYLIADREVATLDISPHYKFGNDVSELRMRSRVDGRYWLSSPVTPEDGGSTLSGVVVLN